MTKEMITDQIPSTRDVVCVSFSSQDLPPDTKE